MQHLFIKDGKIQDIKLKYMYSKMRTINYIFISGISSFKKGYLLVYKMQFCTELKKNLYFYFY